MGGHFYLDDPGSELGFFPVPEEEYLTGIFRVAKKHGLKITDKEILEELNLKKIKKNAGKIKKTNLYIDGTNLFAGLSNLFGYKKFPRFKELLRQINKIQRVDKISFYASYMLPRNNSKEERELLNAEAVFYKEVKETKNLYFYKGHRSPTSGKEKGVDVHLAVDMIHDALLKKCDQVIIMTGDADLVYPLEIAKKFGVKTQAIFLPNRFALGIAFLVDKATVLNYLSRFKPYNKDMPKKLKIVEAK